MLPSILTLALLTVALLLGAFSYAILYLAFLKASRGVGYIVLGLLWVFPALGSLIVPGMLPIVLLVAWLSFHGLSFLNTQFRDTPRKVGLLVYCSLAIPASGVSLGLFYSAASSTTFESVGRSGPPSWLLCIASLSPFLAALFHWRWSRNRAVDVEL